MTSPHWKSELAAFFDQRGAEASSAPSIDELCYIAGRDPRLWRDPELLADLQADILGRMQANTSSRVLEVGCAAGFLARLVAPAVGSFVGVDLAEGALTAARRLGLPRSEFVRSDGGRLPLADNSFDAAFCYDVFSNFPSFNDGAPLIAEMLRVVAPGGRVLVGSIPDDATKSTYGARIAEVSADLERRHGPPVVRPVAAPPIASGVTPQIINYYFLKQDFLALAGKLGARVDITDVHARNPYVGYRFNAVFWRTPS